MTVNDKATILKCLKELTILVSTIKVDDFKHLSKNNNSNLSFNERLKRIRKVRGLTQKQLAKKANISVSLITYYETQNGTPSLVNLENLCKALSVSATDLLGF